MQTRCNYNASDFFIGTYLPFITIDYNLIAANQSQVKKMVLLR
ncbi:MAG: hypothetical protein ACRBF0_20215 [Calditrichia bacterium]